MNQSQKEYIYRINKVIDYIEKNLDNELNLNNLASVANFSPYHFHRIFTIMTGETLNNFVKRLRLEKAAYYLIIMENMPISEIAYRCGYSNQTVFCRSFKSHFKISAGKYRESWEPKFSKNGQTVSKNNKENKTSETYLSVMEQLKKWRLKMKTKIEIKEMPAMNLIYCRHIGRFDQINKAYEKLMRWAGPRGLLNFPKTKTVTVYHDDPSITKIEKVRQSACITVDREVKTEGEIGKLFVPGGNFVVGRFEISVTEFENAWNSICLWMTENGYQPDEGYCYELYHNDHEDHPEKKFILDICVPVKLL